MDDASGGGDLGQVGRTASASPLPSVRDPHGRLFTASGAPRIAYHPQPPPSARSRSSPNPRSPNTDKMQQEALEADLGPVCSHHSDPSTYPVALPCPRAAPDPKESPPRLRPALASLEEGRPPAVGAAGVNVLLLACTLINGGAFNKVAVYDTDVFLALCSPPCCCWPWSGSSSTSWAPRAA